MKPWIKYSIWRLGLFVVVFAVLYPLFLASDVMGVQSAGFAAALIAAIVALCVSYLAFGKLRSQVAADLAERRRTPPANPDESVEDL